jgi:hypothetical protein
LRPVVDNGVRFRTARATGNDHAAEKPVLREDSRHQEAVKTLPGEAGAP